MQLSTIVAPELPYLRRFARALTGSQKSGDQYVKSLIETLVADPSLVTQAANIKTALFGGLCKLWASVPINSLTEASVPAWEATVQNRIGNLSSQARLAFLLSAVESFNDSEIAAILGKEPGKVAELREQANREISDMMACDIMIIEDEPLIAMDLQDIVTSLGHRAIGIARTRTEAIRLASKHGPNLVLSDIQLADGSSGIDAVNDILQDFNVPVIFITAYPERLLTGDKPEPAFLITKPFTTNMVKAVIAQALFFDVKAGKEIA